MDSRDKDGISRRRFIVGTSAGVLAVSCSSKKPPRPTDDANVGPVKQPASPREALATLCLLVGPWSTADRSVASEFLERFLSEKRLTRLEKHTEAIATLPTHLPDTGAGGLDKIPLNALASGEKDALLAVLGELYAVEEVRFYVAGEPASGICLGDLGYIAAVPT